MTNVNGGEFWMCVDEMSTMKLSTYCNCLIRVGVDGIYYDCNYKNKEKKHKR